MMVDIRTSEAHNTDPEMVASWGQPSTNRKDVLTVDIDTA